MRIEDEQAWHQVNWPSVRVDGVSNAGTGCVAAWGRHDDGRVVVGLMEGGAFAQIVDVPAEAASHGPVRAVRWGQAPYASQDIVYRLVGVCGSKGLWHCDWTGEIRPATITVDEQGEEATFLWPVSGDEDLRVVAVYGPRRELRVLGGGFPLRLLPPTNRLEVHGGIEDVNVASHSGVVAVAGDLRLDGEPAESCYAWAWSGFLDGGDEGRYSREWQTLPGHSPLVRLTDMGDGPSNIRFAGLRDGQPQTWGIEGFPDDPDELDCPPGAWTGTLLPDSTNDELAAMVAVGGNESVLVVEEMTEPLRLPAGRLQAVAVNEGFWGDPVRYYAVVDGALHVLALDDEYTN